MRPGGDKDYSAMAIVEADCRESYGDVVEEGREEPEEPEEMRLINESDRTRADEGRPKR